MLTVSDLSFKIGDRQLFSGASVVLPTGSKTGFVGKNGSGKTTLFKLLQKQLTPDDGDVEVHPKAKMGGVAQEAPANDVTVLNMVLEADTERSSLLAEAETAQDPNRISEIHMRLADIDAHSAEGRASNILRGLGFEHDRQNIACSELSGGWRMRVALAGVLFAQPDLLLLDEPTNYLDLEGTLWLESYLATYPHTVLMISHDRDLLNKAVNSIIHLDKGKLTFYRGNYDTFEKTRRMQMELHNKSRAKTLDKVAHMQAFVDRFKAKASKAKQAQARMKAIEKLRPPEALFDDDALPFSFTNPKKEMASPMLDFDNASVGYGGPPILSKLDFRIEPDDRIALVGVNGNGKSTFAKLLAAELRVEEGQLRRGRGFTTAYFAQHQMDTLRPEQTAVEHVSDLMRDSTEGSRRARVARMGLSTQKMDTLVKNLSGGERARLLLGLITFSGPSMLILDEPTNHLDIDSRDALVAALNDYEGAVLVISHDRHLIEATMDRIWIAENGTINEFDGDMETYQRMIMTTAQKTPGRSKGGGGGGNKVDRKRERQEAAARRALISPLRKEVKAIEQKMAQLKLEAEQLRIKLDDPALYTGDSAESVRLGKQKGQLEADLAQTEELWLRKSDELEQAQTTQAAQ